jgi:hypothetical protein
MNDTLATPPTVLTTDSPEIAQDEYEIDLPSIYATRAGNVGRLLKKSLGENVAVGDVLAERTGGLGLKKEQVLAMVPGIIYRFERNTGKLIIRKSEDTSSSSETISPEELQPILSPLDGKISVCNNGQIVIEGKTTALAGIKGVGGKASGELVIIATQDGEPVESRLITGDMIGKILLVPYMTRDALVKASAIGVAGVIGISIVQEDLDYLTEKKLNLPVMDIDKDVAKKLKEKSGKQIFIEGLEKVLLIS